MKKILIFVRTNRIFVFSLAVAFSMWLVFLFASPNSKYADESTHYRQISWFMKGNYGLRSDLTTIPGYHAVVALLAKPLGHASIAKVRFVSFILSILSLAVFFAIAKKLGSANPYAKTLQFVFLPISFLYFPLIYTDIFSLLLVLAVFYFALKKQYNLSALFSLAAVLTRQNNIIWVLFVWLYDYVSTYGFKISSEIAITHARRTIGYMIVCFAFVLFAWFNKGIAIGDRENQQVGLYMGNIYFFLATAGVLFLPILASMIFRAKLVFFESKKSLIFGIGIGILTASCFIFFPPAVHIYNQKMAFLRNIILQSAYHEYVWLYATAILLGCAALFSMKFQEKTFLIFPFLFLFLLPSLLVEQRYLIIPLVFLLLLRKEISNKMEYLLAGYFFLFSAGLMGMIFYTNIFF